jgi:hypothetical protein
VPGHRDADHPLHSGLFARGTTISRLRTVAAILLPRGRALLAQRQDDATDPFDRGECCAERQVRARRGAPRRSARRELGSRAPPAAAIAADGSFVIPRLRLRKIADNSFTVTIHAPPNAPRKVLFSAICLDCLAGGAPPPAQQ